MPTLKKCTKGQGDVWISFNNKCDKAKNCVMVCDYNKAEDEDSEGVVKIKF